MKRYLVSGELVLKELRIEETVWFVVTMAEVDVAGFQEDLVGIRGASQRAIISCSLRYKSDEWAIG